jgi:hypothetical protein
MKAVSGAQIPDLAPSAKRTAKERPSEMKNKSDRKEYL